MIHGDLLGQNVHVPYSFEYADAATRDASIGFVFTDIGKLCRVLFDNTLWMLASTTPITWVGIASGTNSGVTAAVSAGITFPPTPISWELFYRTDLDNVYIWNPQVGAWIDVTAANASGDMFKIIYDPTNVAADAFAMDNMAQGTTNLYISPAEQAKIAAAEIIANKGVPSGYASLDANSEVVQLPAGASIAAAGAVLQQDGQWVLSSSGGGGSTALPIYTQAQIDALTPTNGLTVFNTTWSKIQVYASTYGQWETVTLDHSSVSHNVIVTQIDMVLHPRFNYYVEVDAVNGPRNITIPDAAISKGVLFAIKAINMPNSISATPSGGTIDGLSSYYFAHVGDSITIISNGVNWEVISSDIFDMDSAVDLTAVSAMVRQNTYNIGMNAFRLSAINIMSKNNMVNGLVDEYVDVININGSLSSYGYNPGASYLFNSGSNPTISDPISFEANIPLPTSASNVQIASGSSFAIAGTQTILSMQVALFAWTGVILSPTGTGSLTFSICRMATGMHIGDSSDKPSLAYATNTANQVYSNTYTEAQLVGLLNQYTMADFQLHNWFNVVFTSPVTMTEGEYFWFVQQVGLPAPNGAAIGVEYYLATSGYLHGHFLQLFSAVTFNSSFVIPMSIVAQKTTAPGVLISNKMVATASPVRIRVTDLLNYGEAGIAFRVSDFCTITSIDLPIGVISPNPIAGAGTGSWRIAIQATEFGLMSSRNAVAYSYAAAQRTATNIAEVVLTETQIGAGLTNWASLAAAATDISANGPGFNVAFATPVSLAPGEYVITIDDRTNPLSAITDLIFSNDAINKASVSYMLRMGTGGTSVPTQIPIFNINGTWDGASANLVVISTPEVAIVAPTTIYASFVVNTSIAVNTDFVASVSRDNGITWTQVALSAVNNNSSVAGTKIVYGSVDVSTTPTGMQIMYKAESFNSASAKIHASNLQWS